MGRPLKQHIAMFPLSAAEIVQIFRTGTTLEVIKGLPADAVLTGISKGINQEAYVFSFYSRKLPASHDLDTHEISRDRVVQYALSRQGSYITTMSPYNRFQRLVMRLIRVPA